MKVEAAGSVDVGDDKKQGIYFAWLYACMGYPIGVSTFSYRF